MMGRTSWGMLAATVTCVALLGGTAEAKTFKPTRFNDPEPGQCERKDCSLREAITAANEREGADRIKLSAGHYVIQRLESHVFNLDGSFDVTGPLAIEGKGAEKTTVDGKGISRVFDLTGDEGQILSGLTVKGGFAPTGGGGVGIGEGAVLGSGGKVTISDIVVKGNSGWGGGIDSRALELEIVRTTVTNNSTMGGASVEGGGGIRFSEAVARTPDITIRDSTISDNEAQTGGGIVVETSEESTNLNIVNSTIAGNTAVDDGGGIAATDAVVDLYHVSIGNNEADSDGTGGGDGGGVFQAGFGTFQIADSVLSSNSVGASGTGPECAGNFIGAGNVITEGGCASFPQGPNVITATGSTTLELASNGGPTKTLALKADSEANGFANGCPNRDQRGEKRPDNCDSGAYERRPVK